ncbi:hypothetical protein [Roseospira goensis]|uniref:Uncharacterized protein n=1 Tax=Roseospira goensis TaxID=391922 RepID=A0A7W6WM54_9PROT|nr:hypothetical protein [Roseospira goensis]MBB4287413.1 hypothetical protein [Roseospira goensis]
MFITLVVTACVAALVAGVILLGFRTVGRRPPKYVLPMAIALSILAYVTYSRYTWSDTVIGRMPESVEIIHLYRESSPLEPWTYLWPRVTHFAAIDRDAVAGHPSLPGVYLVPLILVGEGDPTVTVPHVLDCVQGRRANLGYDASLNPADLPETVTWQTGREPDFLFDAVCD